MTEENNNKIAPNAMWGGRFARGPADAMNKLNASIGFDQKLAFEDIQGSRAHCAMLAQQGIITNDDRDDILQGLKDIEREIKAGNFNFREDREDIHMNIEARLAEIVGDAAGRLHTARSRNDQVATDLRLWVRGRIDELDAGLADYQRALIGLAAENVDTLIAGTTHLQAAQPVTFAHHLLAYVEMAGRDRGRLADCRARMNECPLGAGALAGTSFPIDRDMTAKALSFDAPMRNSMDAVSDRDFAVEFVFAITMAATHLSRMGEEIVIWASQPYGYVSLDDAYSTGSSIMPQKRNPDGAELIRAKVGRITGDLITLLTILKGLPMTYGKDLQEDKEAVFDAVEHFSLSLAAMTGMIETLGVNGSKMATAANSGHITATDLADWLVRVLDIPFRTAHEITGTLVAMADKNNCELSQLSLAAMQAVEARIDDRIFDVLSPANALNSRTSYGGTAPSEVAKQLAHWKGILKR